MSERFKMPVFAGLVLRRGTVSQANICEAAEELGVKLKSEDLNGGGICLTEYIM